MKLAQVKREYSHKIINHICDMLYYHVLASTYYNLNAVHFLKEGVNKYETRAH